MLQQNRDFRIQPHRNSYGKGLYYYFLRVETNAYGQKHVRVASKLNELRPNLESGIKRHAIISPERWIRTQQTSNIWKIKYEKNPPFLDSITRTVRWLNSENVCFSLINAIGKNIPKRNADKSCFLLAVAKNKVRDGWDSINSDIRTKLLDPNPNRICNSDNQSRPEPGPIVRIYNIENPVNCKFGVIPYFCFLVNN